MLHYLMNLDNSTTIQLTRYSCESLQCTDELLCTVDTLWQVYLVQTIDEVLSFKCADFSRFKKLSFFMYVMTHLV
jgi:hypothetical protein